MVIRTAVWGEGKDMAALLSSTKAGPATAEGDSELAASLAAFGLRME